MISLKNVFRSAIEFVKLLAFRSRLFYLMALCTIWELPSILAQHYTLILKRVKSLRRTQLKPNGKEHDNTPPSLEPIDKVPVSFVNKSLR